MENQGEHQNILNRDVGRKFFQSVCRVRACPHSILLEPIEDEQGRSAQEKGRRAHRREIGEVIILFLSCFFLELIFFPIARDATHGSQGTS